MEVQLSAYRGILVSCALGVLSWTAIGVGRWLIVLH